MLRSVAIAGSLSGMAKHPRAGRRRVGRCGVLDTNLYMNGCGEFGQPPEREQFGVV